MEKCLSFGKPALLVVAQYVQVAEAARKHQAGHRIGQVGFPKVVVAAVVSLATDVMQRSIGTMHQ